MRDGVLAVWEFCDEDPMDETAKELIARGGGKNNAAADPMAFAAENHCRQIARFAEAIEEGKPVDVDGREAKKSVEIIEAVYRSAQSGTEQILS